MAAGLYSGVNCSMSIHCIETELPGIQHFNRQLLDYNIVYITFVCMLMHMSDDTYVWFMEYCFLHILLSFRPVTKLMQLVISSRLKRGILVELVMVSVFGYH